MTFDGPYGVYHSAYDDHYWIANIGDPGFKYHTLMAQFWGTVALRLANADVLPYAMETYAGSVREFVRELDGLKNVEGNLDRSPLVEAPAPCAPRPGGWTIAWPRHSRRAPSLPPTPID